MNEMKIQKNPDKEAFEAITEAIAMNDGYCVCKLEHTDSNYCMCEDFRNQEHSGWCHCKRYYKVKKYPIITLCGSTRFKDEFLEAQKMWALRGFIVLSVNVFGHADDKIELTEAAKTELDELHKFKIEMSDAIYVINKGGYIGSSTQAEIEWAEELGKEIYYMESNTLTGYLAGPIFTYGDYLRNMAWAKKIREAFPWMDLYSPIENTDINGVEGKKKFAGSQLIANGDNARLDKTDILIACIDGDVVPAGTAAEIGKFHEKIMRGDHKFIVGICTDNRQCHLTHSEAKDAGGAAEAGEQQYSYHNLYVTGLIKQGGVLVTNIEDAIKAITEWLKHE